MTLTLGSLFSGVGSLDLGIELAFDSTLATVFQVEINDYCRRSLAKNWPTAIQHRDVRDVGIRNLPRVDILAGGYPCIGLSASGKRTGLADPQSALWREYARIIGELRPRIAIIENSSLSLTPVPGTTEPAIERVLSDLAALGYDAWWTCLRAADVGAPHRRRDRLYIVAYPHGDGLIELGTDDLPAHEGVEVESGHDASRRREARGRRTPDGSSRAGAGGVGMVECGLGRVTVGSAGWLDRYPYPARPGELQYSWEPPRRVATTDRAAKERLMALGNVALVDHGYVIGRVAREILRVYSTHGIDR